MPARRCGRRGRDQYQAPYNNTRSNVDSNTTPIEPEVRVTLVDKVLIKHFRRSDKSRCLLLKNSDGCERKFNIIAKIDSYPNIWASVVDNEGSLADIYKSLGSGHISFFLAASYKTSSLDIDMTTCGPMSKVLDVLFFPAGVSPAEFWERNSDDGPQTNIFTYLAG